MAEMEGELKTAILKTLRKVNTMKAQFQDHKRKWGAVSWCCVQNQEDKHEGEIMSYSKWASAISDCLVAR